jgi:hypothetical protein
MNKNTKLTLEKAEEYFNYGVKEGYWEPEEFKDLTKEEFIKKVEHLMNLGDAYANR